MAHATLLETCDATAVGAHIAMHVDESGFIIHEFACELPGYPHWVWTVVMAHDVEADAITVCDAVLLPGDGALVPPEWVPWSKRIQPGDLRPGDLLPSDPNDPRLTPGYTPDDRDMTDAPDVLEAVWELGLGRERVLSAEGREGAAQRWWRGQTGPLSPDARLAPHPCSSCGFFVAIRGALGASFGVCANELSPADGRVVGVSFGCGAHSSVVATSPTAIKADVTLDENEYEVFTLSRDNSAAANVEGDSDASANAQPESGNSGDIEDGEFLSNSDSSADNSSDSSSDSSADRNSGSSADTPADEVVNVAEVGEVSENPEHVIAEGEDSDASLAK